MSLAVSGALSLGVLAAPVAQAVTVDPAGLGPAAAPAAQSPGPGAKPAVTAAQQGLLDARTKARATGTAVVVDALTTETSQTQVNPDGTLSTTAHAQAVRTQRGKNWVDLDPTLRRNHDGTLSPAVAPLGLTLSGGGTGPLATLTTADGKKLAVSAPFALPAPSLNGATATYANVLSDVDLQVTALPTGGWRDVIVVRTAAAAAGPQLKNLHFPVSSTGLSVDTDAAGNVGFKDADGKVRLQAPTPLQWDSALPAPAAPGSGSLRSRSLMAAPAAPAASGASTAEAPGDQAREAPIGIRATSTGIDLTPDPATFGKGTGPWYLDPTISADSGYQASAQVQEYHPDTKYYNAVSDLGAGYCGYSDCTGHGRERAYFQLGINAAIYTQPGGAPAPPTVYNSTFYANVSSASSPSTSTPLGLYWTGAIDGNTTWNNQPCNGGSTMGGCTKVGSTWITGTGPISFDVTSQLQQAASGHWSNWTVGIAPDDESNMYYRKHITNNPHITTTYDLQPSAWYPRSSPQPGFASSNSHFDCTSGGAHPWDNAGWIGANQNITLTASNWSPAGLPLHQAFRMWDDNNSQGGWTGDSGWQGAYNVASVNVGSLTDGHQYGWTSNAYDADPTNQGLGSPETGWCYFRVDKTPPTASVSSTDFPPSGTANPTPAKYSSDQGTFTLSAVDPAPAGGSASGPACFKVSTSSSPTAGWHCGDPGTLAADANGKAGYSYVPGSWGTNTLYVQAQDNAGNYSQPVFYNYYAPWKPGSTPVFGDVNGDNKPDVLLPDSQGNLRLIQPGIDPAGTSTISSPPTAAVGGTGWNGIQITHRGSLLGGKWMDDLIAHPAGDPQMYLYQNDLHGNFSVRSPFYKSGSATPGTVTCQDNTGVTITCPADFGGSDWSTTTQILALGSPDGEGLTPSTDPQGHPVSVMSRTSLLAVISGKLWLFPAGTTSARLLKPTDRQVSGADWSQYDLIGPGPANGNNQPTLWSRSRIDGTIHAYPLTKNTDGTTNYSALSDPASGYIAGTGGVDPTTYPTVGSVGDLTGDKVPDLYAVTKDHHLLVWPGTADTTGKVTGFTPPNDLGPVDAALSPNFAPGTVLHPGDTAYAAHTRLSMQLDGNLVLYSRNTGQALWSTNTFGTGNWASFQADGNLVVYSLTNNNPTDQSHPLWSSNTNGTGARAAVQDDCNFVIYNASNSPVWSSNTYNPNP
ncbi:hypothetical protein P3T37_000169 [Kitasatospora sp. MAA4]|uniref:hypothetical protein n=1 Tax=Kitasatospora sp. MAA4 TaxID=3035093 RepID=UPI002473D391|nr:hypothetical protein [Kitasatospora sp. MAA4]MDH6130802.1 hypothetical protein [Kitasatospora sp. MAA4]